VYGLSHSFVDAGSKKMARLPRLNLPGVAQHITQRGNNREACFANDEDCAAYMHHLSESAKKHQVAIHAFALMTNHVHILATPKQADGIAKLMQGVGRNYVPYFNHVHHRTGTLWEGRYKACLVADDRYLLECYRYIELNPVKSGMVERAEDYRWSSHKSNAFGLHSNILTPHELYLQLGDTKGARLQAYRALFAAHQPEQLKQEIALVLDKGLVLGNEQFKRQVAQLLNRNTEPRGAGRPVGTTKSEEQTITHVAENSA